MGLGVDLVNNGVVNGLDIRSERKSNELQVVRRIAGLPPQERLEVWAKETGKSQAALYRRLSELKGSDSHISRCSTETENCETAC
jgi:hypothetical protein